MPPFKNYALLFNYKIQFKFQSQKNLIKISVILDKILVILGQSSGKQYVLMLINTGVSNEATVRRKLLNFEFWINGELSKIGHHFSNKDLKIDFIKNCQ